MPWCLCAIIGAREAQMKIDIVGNHCTWTNTLNTSFIINDDMLFDVPIGSFKSLYNDYDLKNIDYIIISHFHSDHFCDIPLVLEVIAKMGKSVTILAPKGCKQRIESLMRLVEVPHLIPYLDTFNFIDAENGKIVKIGNYKIKCFSAKHGWLDAYGYLIDDGSVKVGFSGDTAMCNNVRKIAKACKAMFIDASSVVENEKHLATFEIKALMTDFPKTIFYPVHFSTASEKSISEFGINKTYQGQTIIVEN